MAGIITGQPNIAFGDKEISGLSKMVEFEEVAKGACNSISEFNASIELCLHNFDFSNVETCTDILITKSQRAQKRYKRQLRRNKERANGTYRKKSQKIIAKPFKKIIGLLDSLEYDENTCSMKFKVK
jgi:hypothetical protein